ncbi:hypothetical protein CcI49_03305 [Frankia sp. CcI49]|nr:hypothetical protein ACG83_10715 [Frankia sp. R43]ONH62503.1 hypothetical protein CcI49_03305 [Frankia sp. CcI49]
MDAAGNLAVRERAASTGTHTNVAASASAVTVLAANTARIGAAITNESTATLYLRVGAGTVTATSYTVALGPGDYYELPARYTGIVSGIWSAADGAARVAEWT